MVLWKIASLFQVHVEATGCLRENVDSNQMQYQAGPWSVHITPRGYSLSVRLQITLHCEYG